MNNSQINREWLRQVLDNPNWQEVVSRVRSDLYADWCEGADSQARDAIYHTNQCLDLLVAKFRNMAHG